MAAGYVPTSPLNTLYSNTTAGTAASPDAVDGAVQAIVTAVNDNYDYTATLISAGTLSRLGVYNLDDTAVGDGTTDDYAALNALLTTIGSASATIAITKVFRIATNITIPSNVTLWFLKGGQLKPDSSKTVTINGAVAAGVWQIFSGSGSIAGSMKVIVLYPQWWGATGDGVTDDTVPTQAAITATSNITSAKLFFPPGTYKLTAPLVIPNTYQGFVMEGSGDRKTRLDIQHSGVGIQITSGNSHVVRHMLIQSTNVTYQYVFTGINVKDSINTLLDDISIFSCKDCIVLEGGTYVTQGRNLFLYNFDKKGVYIKQNVSSPNSNNLYITAIQGRSPGYAGSYGVYIENGSINSVQGGEISNIEIAIYQVAGTRNSFRDIWLEDLTKSIKIDAGSLFSDCHGTFINDIAAGANVFNYNGMATPYSDFTKKQLNQDKSLKALWFFNEGTGSRVLDKSGNKKHITLQGTPTWTTDGTWGTAAYFKNSDGRRIAIPLDTVDWTQPFTYAMNYSSLGASNQTGLYIHSNSGNQYLYVLGSPSVVGVTSYNNPTLENPAQQPNGRFGTSTAEDIWIFIYVDPAAKTIEMLDPYGEKPTIVLTNAIPVTTPTVAYLSGRDHVSNTSEGNISMAMFFQRKLTLSEVYSIANSTSRPFKEFDTKVALSTTLVSANGSSYKVTVSDAGALTTTLL